jgi:hypothetical protein
MPASDAPAAPAPDGSGSAELPQIAGGRYAIGDEVGRGGLGRVLRARDRVLDREVAVKELIAGDEGARRRFVREALITARLQHPSIVSVYEAGRWGDGAPFYAMKLVAGRPLSEAIADATTLEARLALVPTVLAVADAIAYAHARRIVHRDLKPGNVLVGEFGETVVIDWGLAKDLSSDDRDAAPAGPYREAAGDHTVVGSVLGTPAYMAPEQAAGEEIDERADVYALGAMLYHVIAGAIPHEGPSLDVVIARVIAGEIVPLAEREPRAPADLAAIVSKAMAREPAARYPTARELAEDLRRFQAGQLVGAHRYSRLDRVVRWIRRHRAITLVTAAAVLVLITYGTWSVRRILVESERADRARDEAIANADTATRQRDAALANANQVLVEQAHDALARNPTEALAYLRRLDPSVPAGWSAARLIATDVLSRPRIISAIDGLPIGGERTIPFLDDAGRRLVSWDVSSIAVVDLPSATIRRYAVGVAENSMLSDRGTFPQLCDDNRHLVVYGRPPGGDGDRVIEIDLDAGTMQVSPPGADWRSAYARCHVARRIAIEHGAVSVWDPKTGAFGAPIAMKVDVLSRTKSGAGLTIVGGDLIRIAPDGTTTRLAIAAPPNAAIEDRSDDAKVVLVRVDRKRTVWHLDTGAHVALESWPGAAALSPDATRVAMSSAVDLDVFDARTGKMLADIGEGGMADRLDWSPDGRWVVTRTPHGLFAGDTTGSVSYELLGHDPTLLWWRGSTLFTWHLDQSLRAWSFDGVGARWEPVAGSMGWSRDRRWHVTIDDFEQLTRTDTRGHAPPEHVKIDRTGRADIAVDAAGDALIVTREHLMRWPHDGAPVVLSETHWREDQDNLLVERAGFEHIAVSPDERWAAVGRPLHEVELVEVATGAHHPLTGSSGVGVAFLPGGELVTGAPGGGLLRWNPADGSHRALVAPAALPYGDDMPYALACTPDGASIAVARGALPPAILDVASGTVRPLGRLGKIDHLAFVEGGRVLVGAGNIVAIWDPASGFARQLPLGYIDEMRVDGDRVTFENRTVALSLVDDLPFDPKELRAKLAALPSPDDVMRPRIPLDDRPRDH